MANQIEIVMFVTHSNGVQLPNGVDDATRRYTGTGASVRTAIKDAASKIPIYFPFRKNSSTKLTITVERTK